MQVIPWRVHIACHCGSIQSCQQDAQSGRMFWPDSRLRTRLSEFLQAFVTVTLDHLYSVYTHYMAGQGAICIEEIGTLQAFQISADFRAAPVLWADHLAAYDSISVYDVSLRPALGVEELCGGLCGIANCNQVHMVADKKAAVGVRVIVNADSQDGQIGPVVVKFEHRGHFSDAGRALTPPEVEQHDAAPVVGQMYRGRAVGDGEVRGWLAGQGRMCAPVTAGRECQR